MSRMDPFDRIPLYQFLHEQQRRFYEEQSNKIEWECGCDIEYEADGSLRCCHVCPDHTYEVIKMTREELAISIKAVHAKKANVIETKLLTE